MKNKIDLRNLTKCTMLLTLLCSLTNCISNEQASCTYKGCDYQRPTIKNANQVKGRITTLSGHPDTWIIVSEEGIIGQNTSIIDGPDIVIACNLADSLKILNQRVIFSGELKDSCDEFKALTSKIYYSYLTYIIINTK
jgi:hypothetical protein